MNEHENNEFQSILSQLLEKKELSFPFQAEDGYRNDLEAKLALYKDCIDNLSGNGTLTTQLKENLNKIDLINAKLIKSLDDYLSGNSGQAYKHIHKLMNNDQLTGYLANLNKNMDLYSSAYDESHSLYRVRTNLEDNHTREQIFHIPFDKRHLVKNQRYSIAGVPCLYLGTSIYVCWHEMNRPDLSSLSLSHFKINSEQHDVKVINFAYSLDLLHSPDSLSCLSEKISPDLALSYLTIWPFVMACSYKVKHKDASFSVEHVIPNLIFQWIKKNKHQVLGIKYLSTKTEHVKDKELGVNYAFPPRSQELQGTFFCTKLSNIFKLSEPMQWQLLDAHPTPDQTGPGTTYSAHSSDSIEYTLLKNYKKTKFAEMETKLRKFGTLKIISN